MARTKRKANPLVPELTPATSTARVYKAAGYVRLSVEDGGKPGADTLEGQKALIGGYIAEQADMQLVGLFCDNGRSGTDFARPQFEKLMDLVRKGQIDCIVVKDLSRFGRNYKETGNYLERIFPFLGVRFIAINDNFDTLTAERTQDGYIVPLKNLINEVYSKDISRKSGSALETKQLKGEFIGAWAPYGYSKDPENKNHLIAANLGGMLTPFGNPQNLYLYTFFNIPTGEFMGIMAPPFAVSIALLTVCCLFVRPEPMEIEDEPIRLPTGRTVLYLVLFVLAIVIVFRVIPYWIGLVVIPAVLLIADPKALKMVDYPLLLTFVFFFVFAGNMARIDAVRDLLGALMSRDTLLFSTLSCQFISNVPSAILLSHFTDNYRELLLGVNIGGTGTLIASLASLITFREYVKHNPGRTKYYIGVYSAFNLAFLGLLLAFTMLTR